MRILFLSLVGTFPFEAAGPQNVAYHLVRELKDKDLNIDFAFGIARRHFKSTSYTQFCSEMSKRVNLIPIVKDNPRSVEVNRLEFWRQAIRLATEVGRNKPAYDAIHFNSLPNTRELLVPVLSKLRKIPTIYNLHGWLTYETRVLRNSYWSANVYNFVTYKLLCKSFSTVVCNSNYLKQKGILDGINSANIKVIPNGVDIARFQSEKEYTLKVRQNCFL